MPHSSYREGPELLYPVGHRKLRVSGLLFSGNKSKQNRPYITTTKKEEKPHVDEQTQQRLETLFAAGIGFGLSRLVAKRFIKDLVPEQRGIKDDVVRALLRAGTTAASAILASMLVRQVAKVVRGRS